MGIAAVAQVNARPVWRPGTRSGDERPAGAAPVTRHGAYYGAPADLLVWVAAQG